MKRKKSMQKAAELWPDLIQRASEGKKMTYAEARDLLDYPTCQPVNHVLWNITHYCESAGLPLLTSIVVSQKTGKPGKGFTEVVGDDVDAMQRKVFEYDWRTSSFGDA